MKNIRKLTLSAVCLSFCMVLPLLTGQIPEIGKALSPMHIPVFILGFTCGWQYGLAVGFIAPIMRSLIFGIPQMMPMAVSMAFEIAVYGLVCGLLYRLLPKKFIFLYPELIISMLAGRAVWGVIRLILTVGSPDSFTWTMFMSGAFTSAMPGIILHIILIPPVVIALKKAGLMLNDKTRA